MKREIILIGLLATGCASPQTTSYWTRKGDVVVVHHVTGVKDSTETLTQKALDSDDAEEVGIKKGEKAYQVANSSTTPAPDQSKKVTKPADEKPKKDTKDSDKSRLADDIRDLKSQVAHLSNEIQANDAASSAPSPDQRVGNNDTALQNPDTPRLSQ